ncbi:S1 family peptidase [Streptomyces sp. NPDC059766]|uniref:S1 family peptidase n=1 Tax=Streptomyces sp. NPDC059766 TaxID=3346940 RepID=UPI003665053F
MKYRRTPGRRAAVAGAGVAALLVAGLTFQNANAGESAEASTPGIPSAAAAGNLASALVPQNLAELESARAVLADEVTVPGTSWVTDPRAGRVVVTADRRVSDADWAKLGEVVGRLGPAVELRRTKGEFKPLIAGGDAIAGTGGRCSLGFNVVKSGQPYFITAGHCTEAVSTWTDSRGATIGRSERSGFPGNDFGLVKYTADVVHPSEVDLHNGSARAVTRAADATVGERVTRSGATTGVHSGRVTGLDATVNYGNGDIVSGLIQTDVCAEAGDSGGPLFDGDAAIGLTSGGSGDCTAGGVTFFQPVTEALSAFGARIG